MKKVVIVHPDPVKIKDRLHAQLKAIGPMATRDRNVITVADVEYHYLLPFQFNPNMGYTRLEGKRYLKEMYPCLSTT